jgi:hypothetical protein
MLSAVNASAFTVTRWLLRHGANIQFTSDDGKTVLHVAAAVDNPSAVMALLRAGSLADQPDLSGRSPLHYAALGGSDYMCVKLLKYAGLQASGSVTGAGGSAWDGRGGEVFTAALNRQDASGYTPLMLAAEHGRLAVVEALLARCPNVGLRSKLHHSGLELADWYGHTAVRTALEQYIASTTPSEAPPLPGSVPHGGGVPPISPMAGGGAGAHLAFGGPGSLLTPSHALSSLGSAESVAQGSHLFTAGGSPGRTAGVRPGAFPTMATSPSAPTPGSAEFGLANRFGVGTGRLGIGGGGIGVAPFARPLGHLGIMPPQPSSSGAPKVTSVPMHVHTAPVTMGHLLTAATTLPG